MSQTTEKHKNLIHALLFVLVFTLVFLKVQSVFKTDDDRFNQSVTVLHEEKPGTVDAIYIGSSNVECFWIPVSAWQNHGISVLAFTSNAMPVEAWIYMIEEIRKTQPDALIILNLNPFKADIGPYQASLHRIADYMPFSANKLRMINDLTNTMRLSLTERLEFYFPFIRFHSKWSTLSLSDFKPHPAMVKNSVIDSIPHWHFTADLSEIYNRYSKENDLTERQGRELVKLIDYLDRKKPNVLFVTVPQAIDDKPSIGQINKVESILKDHGYHCLNLFIEPEITGISLIEDFFDKEHLNVHGALKYTEFLSKYLIENYGFTDKRGEPGWESWETANTQYNELIAPYTLPFERNAALRDYDLPSPEPIETGWNDGKVVISWTESKGADAYEIWRKNEENKSGNTWQMIERVEKNQLSFEEKDIQSGKEYTYTVVPLRKEAENEVYGNFSYKGVTVTTE